MTPARGWGADGPDILQLLALSHSRLGRLVETRAEAKELAAHFPQYRRQPEIEQLLSGPK